MKRMILAIFVALLFLFLTEEFIFAEAPSPSITVRQWEQMTLPEGVSFDDITDFAVSPANSHVAFLATYKGLYRTDDAGKNWTRVATDTLSWVYGVAIARSNPQRLYAESWYVYRSDDSGNTWFRLDSPHPTCGIAVAPSDEDRIYALACWGSEAAIYRSDDGGISWITPTIALSPTLRNLAIAPSDPDLLIASGSNGTFRSTDGGFTWEEVPADGYPYPCPVFDPHPPYTIYLGLWNSLLRSTDGGQTWEDGDLDREFATLIPSPFSDNELLGGSDEGAWRIKVGSEGWQAIPWEAPMPLRHLAYTPGDGDVIYARTDSGWWRYVSRTLSYTFTVYLPLVSRSENQYSFPEASQQALERANLYRARAGVMLLCLHPAIVTAAQNHANYYMLNHDDPSAWEYGAHGEVEGKPGYTGRWPSDRIKAAGFPWSGGSEVMHFIGDPIASVDGWMATVYHRVIMLDPDAHYTGYGYGKDGSVAVVAVDVMDFGTGPTDKGIWRPLCYPLAYPADGQTEVPISWDGGEYPDPLPPDASRPVGYPFTIQGAGGLLEVEWAEMRDGSGNLVEVHPNPPDCSGFNCYALIPVSPLQPNTTYTVHARGEVCGIPFDRTWQFTTGEATGAALEVRKRIGPPWK